MRLQNKYVVLPNEVLSRYKWENSKFKWFTPTPPEQVAVLRGLLVGFDGTLEILKNQDTEKYLIQQTKNEKEVMWDF